MATLPDREVRRGQTTVLQGGRTRNNRPELLYRDHVLDELIDGDLGTLVKA